jgi:hypothetical protein
VVQGVPDYSGNVRQAVHNWTLRYNASDVVFITESMDDFMSYMLNSKWVEAARSKARVQLAWVSMVQPQPWLHALLPQLMGPQALSWRRTGPHPCRFCLAPYGWGWGVRLSQIILAGCVPVIIQPHVFQPFEDLLDYSQFSVRLPR